jgi:hypothetical protein
MMPHYGLFGPKLRERVLSLFESKKKADRKKSMFNLKIRSFRNCKPKIFHKETIEIF